MSAYIDDFRPHAAWVIAPDAERMPIQLRRMIEAPPLGVGRTCSGFAGSLEVPDSGHVITGERRDPSVPGIVGDKHGTQHNGPARQLSPQESPRCP